MARHVDLADGGLLLEHVGQDHAARGIGGLDLHVFEVTHLPDSAHVLLQNVLIQRRAGQRVQGDADGVVFDLAVATELDAHHLQAGDLHGRLRLCLGLNRQRGRSQALRRLRSVVLSARKAGREHCPDAEDPEQPERPARVSGARTAHSVSGSRERDGRARSARGGKDGLSVPKPPRRERCAVPEPHTASRQTPTNSLTLTPSRAATRVPQAGRQRDHYAPSS